MVRAAAVKASSIRARVFLIATLAVAARGLLIATRADAAARDFHHSDKFSFATVRSRARRKVVVRIFRRRLFRLSLNSSFDGNIQ